MTGKIPNQVGNDRKRQHTPSLPLSGCFGKITGQELTLNPSLKKRGTFSEEEWLYQKIELDHPFSLQEKGLGMSSCG